MASAIIKWADIEAEANASGFRERLVAVFRKYEGQSTDEKDGQNRTVKVSQSSFARHMGVAEQTFKDWVKRTDTGRSLTRSQTKQASDRRFVKSIVQQDPDAINEAIRENPQVAAAAAQALVDAGDIKTLSSATAKVAKNKQVERNRQRATSGLPKQSTVQGPKPTLGSPVTAAFLSDKALPNALRALVTDFPQEWASRSGEVRQDADYIAVQEETLDKIIIAVESARALIHGGVSDADLERLLEGAP